MNDIVFQLLVSSGLGAFIGLQFRKNAEQGKYTKTSVAGLRTCIILCLFGWITTLLSQHYESMIILSTAFVAALIGISYWYSIHKLKKPGITSELLLMMVFLMGILVGINQINLAVILTIIMSIVSTGKGYLYQVSDKFNQIEIIDTVKFAIIIFLILPILPNRSLDAWGIFNPAEVWTMVILVSGIGFVGYMASKFIKKKSSIIVTGLVGGLISSTAVTTNMALQSKKQENMIDYYAISILLGSGMMYARVLLATAVINPELCRSLVVPLGAMILFTALSSLIMWKRSKESTPKLKQELEVETPLSLIPAFKFSLIYVAILALITFANQYLGSKGIYISALFSGIADVDAITLSLSQLSSELSISSSAALIGITIAVISNTWVKILYVAFIGSNKLLKKVSATLAISALIGMTMAILV